MLYLMQSAMAAMSTPTRQGMRLARAILNHPQNQFGQSPAGRDVAAWLSVFDHLGGMHHRPAWKLDHVTKDGKEVPVQAKRVLKRAYCELTHFEREGGAKGLPRVLIVAPMSGHFATLLRGTVEALLPDHDVYITEWLDCKHIPKTEDRFNLNDFIDYLVDFLHFLGPRTHLLAVCQPTVAALAASSIMADWGDRCQPMSITLVAGPIDTRVNPTAVNEFASAQDLTWFKDNLIQVVPPPFLGMGRRVYPGFIQLNSFMAMNMDRHKRSISEMHDSLVAGDQETHDRRQAFYDEYLSVMDLPEDFYLQTIEAVFQSHALPMGKMMSRWHAVDPSHIRKPYLFVVEGEADDICGVGQTQAALHLTTNLPDKHKKYLLVKGVGHYGTFNGRVFRETIAPQIKTFIEDAEHHVNVH